MKISTHQSHELCLDKRSAPQLAIVIVFNERIELTKKCLISVYNNTTIPFSIFLVNNASTSIHAKSFLSIIGSINNINIITLSKNMGCAIGRNVGLKKIPKNAYKFISILDNDCEVLPSWDLEALKYINKYNLIGIQPLLLKNLHTIDKCILNYQIENNTVLFKAKYTNINVNKARNHDIFQNVNVLMGVSIVKRELFDSVGYYDENCCGMEDFDMSLRINKIGYKIMYIPTCKIIHNHKISLFPSSFDIKYEENRFCTEKTLRTYEYLFQKYSLHFISKDALEHLKFLQKWKIQYSANLYKRVIYKLTNVLYSLFK